MTSEVVDMTPKVVRVTVYMSPELKEKIKQLSFDGPRVSLNAKVVFILEQYFEQRNFMKSAEYLRPKWK